MRKKYNVSESGMDKLMKRLAEIAQEDLEKAQENQEESVVGLMEAEITTNFVKAVTKVKGIEDVIKRNDHLTKHFRGFLDMYGFESMYDMYVYAMSCDVVPEQLHKARDYSKLVPVKRTIMRNGKETEVTVYINPNKEDGEGKEEGTERGSGRNRSIAPRRRRHARELISDLVGSLDNPNPKDIANIKAAAKELPKGNKPFQDNSQFYLAIKDEEGNIVGVIGYSEVDGKYLTMDFYRTNGEVSGVAAKGFFELLKVAAEKEKGVKMPDQPEAGHVFMQSGLKQQKDGTWVIEADELHELLGKGSDINSE